MKAFLPQIIFVLALNAMSGGQAVSAWQANGIPVRPPCAEEDASPMAIVPDGGNGALVTCSWSSIYGGRGHASVEKISRGGSMLWDQWVTTTGLAGAAHMIPDGAGGALVALPQVVYLLPLATVSVVRIGAGGDVNTFWPSTRSDEDMVMQQWPHVTWDGVGGAIVTWMESSTATDGWDIFVQRNHAAGTRMWGPYGIVVSGEPDNQSSPRIATDETNGAIVVWNTPRRDGGGTIVAVNLQAQRVDSSGVFLWGPGGVDVSTAAATQDQPGVVPDGAGGAIIVWRDDRRANDDIFAQRIDPIGKQLWAPDDVAVCDESGDQWHPLVVSDGSGGAIVAWIDNRSGDHEIYAQRLGPEGNILWSSGGVLVTDEMASDPVGQVEPSSQAVCSDGEGGVIIAWPDARDPSWDVYGQRLDSTGMPLWLPGGLPVCTAAGLQNNPKAASDGDGGAIVTWCDYRSGDYCGDVYAQRIYGDGVPAAIDPGDREAPVANLALRQNHPNPFNPTTTISFVIDKRQHVSLTIYDTTGRRVRTLVDRTMDAGVYAEEWNGLDARGHIVASGVYFYRLSADKQTITRTAVFLK